MLADESGKPVNLRVVNVEENPDKWLSHKLIVKDEEGYEYIFQIYHANNAYQDWKLGNWYEVRDYGLSKKPNPPYLQSTNRMQVKRIDDVGDEYTIAVIGDTHLGYKKRNNKVARRRNIDCVEAFDAAVSVVTEVIRPDAVIQTGDILDDRSGYEEARKFAEGVDRLNEFGTVYYVKGNHGNENAASYLADLTSDLDFEHLGLEGVKMDDDGDIMLCGLDEGRSLRPFIDINMTRPKADVEIAVFHENVKEGDGKLSLSDADEERGWDAYIVGHYHDASDFNRREADTGLGESLTLYTGSIDGISKSKGSYSTWYDQDPCVWELKIRDGTIECTRHSLVPKLRKSR